MVQRIRQPVEEEATPCGLCGHQGLVIERSRNRRRAFDRLNPRWDPQERIYRICPTCHARHRLIDGQPI